MNLDIQILTWIMTTVGLTGFLLVGKKIWWAWYINLGVQILWAIYALVTGQPAFLASAVTYFLIFALNAFKWTRDERKARNFRKRVAQLDIGGTILHDGVQITRNPLEEEDESNLVKHARHELNLIGEEPEVIDWYIRVIKAYASFGHSGGSAWATTSVLEELLRFKPLTELTDDSEEWFHHGEDIAGRPGGMWQNKRDGRCFSNDGGKTYWNVDDSNNPTMKYYDSISKEQWLEDHGHVPAN
ncbi:hypothetical protein SEA_INKED_70 [Arthrobacter phage Inked]|nr:hypothetical protein SEA_INKED_70 [Arthrobacter phage Inked]